MSKDNKGSEEYNSGNVVNDLNSLKSALKSATQVDFPALEALVAKLLGENLSPEARKIVERLGAAVEAKEEQIQAGEAVHEREAVEERSGVEAIKEETGRQIELAQVMIRAEREAGVYREFDDFSKHLTAKDKDRGEYLEEALKSIAAGEKPSPERIAKLKSDHAENDKEIAQLKTKEAEFKENHDHHEAEHRKHEQELKSLAEQKERALADGTHDHDEHEKKAKHHNGMKEHHHENKKAALEKIEVVRGHLRVKLENHHKFRSVLGKIESLVKENNKPEEKKDEKLSPNPKSLEMGLEEAKSAKGERSKVTNGDNRELTQAKKEAVMAQKSEDISEVVKTIPQCFL